MFEKILIANRGEIAVRVIHACRELGLGSVAVYSDVDRETPHVTLADEAVPLGGASAADSYLNVERLLEAASRTAAGAIHPGYGFLAENAGFARAAEGAGFVFIGPPASAIEAMGDKTAARARMEAAGVPVIPGSDGPLASIEEALPIAVQVGYPVMLKAAGGGGGKGMRTARDPAELESVFESAVREARQAFGDDRVYLERFLTGPRHIEFQILADALGTTIHLGERECSIQRRHQKLVEESPSPVVDPATRARMCEVAVRAAEAVGYRRAGTVEFLVDGEDFYFLEMNTRVQVEHPVTELIMGIDLVQEQIRIARGEAISWTPDGTEPAGHAIECRISAEDPLRGFFPSTGRVEGLRIPAGPGVRWDAGIEEGVDVGLHYDPLLAKLIVHARTRDEAIARMRRALADLRIGGLATTIPFHRAVMEEADFLAGEYSIRYIEEHPELTLDTVPADWRDALLAAAVLLEEQARDGRSTGVDRADGGAKGGLSDWQRAVDPWQRPVPEWTHPPE
jgi:acetyl-CoA carboxylase biotin carboxylase subunit